MSASGWVSELPTLAGLAAVVALSPLSIIPAVLVLQAPRPRPTGLAFLAGWVLSLVALTALFVAASGLLGGLHNNTPPTWMSWLRVVLGSALILFGIYRWLKRKHHTESPRWLRAFDTITPLRAGIIGAVLVAVRPEVLIVCVAAGLDIGAKGLSGTDELISGAFYVAASASTVAIPILAYAAAGERLDVPLARLKLWMDRHMGALLAAVLILIGLMVLHNGLKTL